jgi:hypothetical protein
MNYVIFQTKSGPQLGWYDYYWPSDCFTVGLGTTPHKQRHYCDLDYKILARLSFQETREWKGYFWSSSYPNDNILNINLEDGVKKESLPDISKMKGYKKFFGNKSIKEIVFV